MEKNEVTGPSTLDVQHSTYAVELTPKGRGAVAVVLVVGPDAVPLVEQCFTRVGGRPLSVAPLGKILLGRWGGANGEELVVCRRSAEQVEVHSHGGMAAVEAVMDRLVREGCRRATWQEWVRATDDDPIRIAARIALADAPTARTAAILLDQFQGALNETVRRVLAAIESGEWSQAGHLLDQPLRFRELGRHLTTPWRVVLAGPPNVGKSSLINALAGFQRSIVSHVPGTTRDVVTMATAVDGWPVEFVDTAGLRCDGDELEAAGIALADEAVRRADLVVVVSDASQPGASFGEIRRGGNILRVCNKVDLLGSRHEIAVDPDVMQTSAVTGEGVGDLISAIGRTLVPCVPEAGAAVPFTEGQISAVTAARVAVEQRDVASGVAALRILLAS